MNDLEDIFEAMKHYKLFVRIVPIEFPLPGKELIVYRGSIDRLNRKENRSFFGTGGVPIESDMKEFLLEKYPQIRKYLPE